MAMGKWGVPVAVRRRRWGLVLLGYNALFGLQKVIFFLGFFFLPLFACVRAEYQVRGKRFGDVLFVLFTIILVELCVSLMCAMIVG